MVDAVPENVIHLDRVGRGAFEQRFQPRRLAFSGERFLHEGDGGDYHPGIQRGMPIDHCATRVMHHFFRKGSLPERNCPIGKALDEVHQLSARAAASMRRQASSRLASELAKETRKYGERP